MEQASIIQSFEREGAIRIIKLADLKLSLAIIVLFRLARIGALFSKVHIKSLTFFDKV